MTDDNSEIEVYHRTRRERKSGSRFASILIGLAGFGCVLLGVKFIGTPLDILALFLWIFAILLFAISPLVDVRYALIDYCEACGNDISATTTRCPHCQARILTPESSGISTKTVLSIGLAVALAILLSLALFFGK